uniref:Uncharacterized protein n=1 Tax=Avena sativa TaxID=4498 RepID=A0ACD5XVU6_AVESA
MADSVKVGPWGAPSGQPCDINSLSSPQRLVSISICSNETPGGCINGFSFTYVDQTGRAISSGTWGTNFIGCVTTIKMNPGEHVNHVSGTANNRGVTSLKLGTNQTEHGPYGWPSGPEFSVPLRQGKGEVVAFFGHSGDSLKALGVYVPGRKESPGKVGPWGGHAGSSRDLLGSNMPERLQSISIRSSERSGGRIYGFSYAYLDHNGQRIHVGPWGSKTKGQKREFTMNEDNYINLVSGTHDEYGITSLKFVNSEEEVYGPFGCPTGTAFSVPLPENGAAVGFFGRAGADTLVGFGAYVAPLEE